MPSSWRRWRGLRWRGCTAEGVPSALPMTDPPKWRVCRLGRADDHPFDLNPSSRGYRISGRPQFHSERPAQGCWRLAERSAGQIFRQSTSERPDLRNRRSLCSCGSWLREGARHLRLQGSGSPGWAFAILCKLPVPACACTFTTLPTDLADRPQATRGNSRCCGDP